MDEVERKLLVELGMATLLGGAMGFEREWRGRHQDHETAGRPD